jgi:hypothetical protein
VIRAQHLEKAIGEHQCLMEFISFHRADELRQVVEKGIERGPALGVEFRSLRVRLRPSPPLYGRHQCRRADVEDGKEHDHGRLVDGTR